MTHLRVQPPSLPGGPRRDGKLQPLSTRRAPGYQPTLWFWGPEPALVWTRPQLKEVQCEQQACLPPASQEHPGFQKSTHLITSSNHSQLV